MARSAEDTLFFVINPFPVNPLAPTAKPVHMCCVMDLLLFVATSVYRISPLQLTVLMLVKLLSQDTVEALAYRYVYMYV